MKYTCPLGHKCEVRDDAGNVEERCRWFVQVIGTNPQTGEHVDKWDCAIAFMPVMQIENSQQTRQAGAAIESFRNEMKKGNDQFLGIISQAKAIGNS